MTAAVDLRSDTVTRPTAAMRAALADAPVGDDVYGEDPSVNALQERVAALLGVEDALFVPSGTMGNQLAIKLHTRPGDGVLAGAGAHALKHEAGAAGFVSGVQITELQGDGRFTGDAVRAGHEPDDCHGPPTRLVTVENTHNVGGGLVWSRDDLDGVLAAARELGLATHLDGARLWNAAIASGHSEAELARGFDTVSVCLSKGLGAPVGSVLGGPRALLRGPGLRVRKRLGGAMRQAGVLAAAGLHALEHHRARLADDHANAAYLAREIDALPHFAVDVDAVQTNILMVDVAPELGSAHEVERRAAQAGLLFWTAEPTRFRLVTHLDVDRAACTRAVEILAALARAA